MDTPAPPLQLSLGIIGAGRIGRAIAALGRAAGLEVAVAASRPPQAFRALVEAEAPGARAVTVAEAAAADVVVLAIPLSRLDRLDADALKGALVVDAMNYWWELDGRLPAFEDLTTSSSQIVATRLTRARVVKSLNHVSAYALEELARPAGDADRLAMAVAGDADADVAAVVRVVDALGFEPVVAGSLAEGVRFEPGTELFGADAGATEARDMLARFWDSQRGRVVARARRA